jgi:hypothetical protein
MSAQQQHLGMLRVMIEQIVALEAPQAVASVFEGVRTCMGQLIEDLDQQAEDTQQWRELVQNIMQPQQLIDRCGYLMMLYLRLLRRDEAAAANTRSYIVCYFFIAERQLAHTNPPAPPVS